MTFRVAPRLRAAPPYRLRAEGAELRAGGGHAIRKVALKFLPRATQDAKLLPLGVFANILAYFIATAFMAGLINPHTCNIPAFCIKCEDL